jgi:predicted TIM-barrel fold metal-dependent hydrolase
MGKRSPNYGSPKAGAPRLFENEQMNKPSRMVDTHQHVFWAGRDDKGLIADMDEHGIEYAWLLTFEMPPQENRPDYGSILNPLHVRPDGTHAGIPLQDLILARDRYPSRFVLGYCPHPSVGDAPALLRAAVEIHGARVCGEWKFRTLFDDPRCLELFHAAGELKLPVVLHLDVPYLLSAEGKSVYQPIWYGGTADNLERALQACPQTTFIGHAPGFWREISADAPGDPKQYPGGTVKSPGKLNILLDHHPNLYGDLSAGSALFALKRDPLHAFQFINRYQDRLLFARDEYGQKLHQFIQTLNLSQDVLEKIYYQNAEKLVRK